MITAGVDIGSTTTKAVLLDGDTIRASIVVPTGDQPGRTAENLFARALAEAGLAKEEIAAVAATGYGRRLADFGDIVLTEIKACAAGVLSRPAPGGERVAPGLSWPERVEGMPGGLCAVPRILPRHNSCGRATDVGPPGLRGAMITAKWHGGWVVASRRNFCGFKSLC